MKLCFSELLIVLVLRNRFTNKSNETDFKKRVKQKRDNNNEYLAAGTFLSPSEERLRQTNTTSTRRLVTVVPAGTH